MCLCVSVCICVCACVYLCVCVHACACVCVCVHIFSSHPAVETLLAVTPTRSLTVFDFVLESTLVSRDAFSISQEYSELCEAHVTHRHPLPRALWIWMSLWLCHLNQTGSHWPSALSFQDPESEGPTQFSSHVKIVDSGCEIFVACRLS